MTMTMTKAKAKVKAKAKAMTKAKATQQLQQHQQHQPDLNNNIHPQLAQQVQINQQIQQLLQLTTQLQEEAVRMLFYTKPSSTESKSSQQRSHHITLHLITSPFKSHNVRNIIKLECPPSPIYGFQYPKQTNQRGTTNMCHHEYQYSMVCI